MDHKLMVCDELCVCVCVCVCVCDIKGYGALTKLKT
jgi:hypothetical protein